MISLGDECDSSLRFAVHTETASRNMSNHVDMVDVLLKGSRKVGFEKFTEPEDVVFS